MFGDTAAKPSPSISRELRNAEALERHLKHWFCRNNYELKGLLEVGKDLIRCPPEQLSKFVARSKMDWQMAPCFHPVFETSQSLSTLVRLIKDKPFDNEFLTVSRGSQDFQDLFQAQCQLAQILALSRSMLFSPSLSLHTFTVLLPPGIFTEQIEGGAKAHYLLFPVAHFLRLPHAPHLRRTVSLSVLLVPVDEDCRLREWSIRKTKQALDLARIVNSGWDVPAEGPDGARYTLEGPLASFIGVTSKNTGELRSLREWLESVLFGVIAPACDTRLRKARLRDAVFRAVKVSRYSGFVGTLADLKDDKLVRWAASPEPNTESAVRDWLERLLGEDFIKYHRFDPPSRRLLQAPEYGYPTLIDAPSRLSICPFAPNSEDPEGEYSKFISRLAAGVFGSIGLSALQEMLSVYHHQLEGKLGSTAAKGFMDSFIGDVEEYFDFDLMPDYKLHFESLRRAVGIDRDFEVLRQKLEFLEQQKIIEKTEHTNLVLIVLAMVALLFAAGDWLDKGYIIGYWKGHVRLSLELLIPALLIPMVLFCTWRCLRKWLRRLLRPIWDLTALR